MDASVCASQTHDDHEDLTASALLNVLLLAQPAQRSMDELVRELTECPDAFAERDRVENAIRDLVAAGLAHRHGDFVFATRAAVRFDELRT
jgi:hypothetical protein